MKTRLQNLLILFTLACFISSCDRSYVAPESKTEPSEENEMFLKKVNFLFTPNENNKPMENIENYGAKVNVYNDMLVLFNPDNLECGLSDKIKRRLKKSKRDGKNKKGFVPDIVVNNTSEFKNAIKLDDRGANVLAHYFTYEIAENKESKPIISSNAPSQVNFNAIDHIDNQSEGYESFYFTLDCSGFFSASAKVAAKGGFLGIGNGSIAAEGESTIEQNKSVVVMRVLMHSPLYAAYVGSYVHNIDNAQSDAQKKIILNNRIKTLNAILSAVPEHDRIDDKKVYLNTNYEAIFTSNKGNSGFNGVGQLNSNLEVNISVTQSGVGAEASNSVSRKSEYTSYDTYIIESNKDAIPETITFKKINDKIVVLEAALNDLNTTDNGI
ncbi:hypothetical protein [Winogradskyella sp.]|uniref:hypothetical protein n=1 Tax=Winogradskyella sp. TaxID=1883156 RepID=UPI003BA8BEE8